MVPAKPAALVGGACPHWTSFFDIDSGGRLPVGVPGAAR
jgi:hypothetical protein